MQCVSTRKPVIRTPQQLLKHVVFQSVLRKTPMLPRAVTRVL